MLRRLAARLRVPPQRCVLVEDSVENLDAARAVGMRTVLITGIGHGHRHPAERPRAGLGRRVDLQVQSIGHLPRKAVRTPHRLR